MPSIEKGGDDVLQFVECLPGSFVFKQQIYCSFLRMEVGTGVRKFVVFGGLHNCLICNVKKLMF